jgi:ankyrin repeat protein
MLQWLCFSFRPLRIEELAHIIHVGDAIEPPFSTDTVVFHPEDVLDVCPGLLSLTTIEVQWHGEESWSWTGFQPGTRLQIAQLAHFSVKEYLLQSPHCPTWLALKQELAHLSILKSSMAYFMSVSTKLRNDTWWTYRTGHELAISYSLAIYCGQYTKNHLLALADAQREHPDLLESFRRLLNPRSGFITERFVLLYFNRWFSIRPDAVISRERVPEAGMSLLIAARLGLSRIVEWLLSFDRTEGDDFTCDINFASYMEGGWPCGPALAEAAAQGYIDLVKLLLSDQYRARLDVDRGKNALHLAVDRGHEEIVRLLVDAGADVNHSHSLIMTNSVLHTALGQRNVNINIVHILLTHGADVNALSGWNAESPLQIVVWSGQKELTRMLVDAGANVNYVNLRSNDPVAKNLPLQHAVEQQNIDLVRILLGAKANIGAVGYRWKTPLWTAAKCGHEDIVKLFLDSGEDLTRENKTAALAAARNWNHHTIADILLAAGADPVETERQIKSKLSMGKAKGASR